MTNKRNPHRLEKVCRFQRQSVRPRCEIRIIMGFGQSISQCNFLHPGSGPMGFKGRPRGVKVAGLAGRVQEVAARNAACNEYHGRQSKHNTSSSRTLSPERHAFLSEHCTVTEVSEFRALGSCRRRRFTNRRAITNIFMVYFFKKSKRRVSVLTQNTTA